MSGPGNPDGGDGVHLEAAASGGSTVNQVGRDQHFHFSTGTRRTVQAIGGTDGGCPYPGLASFTAEQAAWFFGRDRLTASLVSRLDACLIGGGPVMVVAASGAGKSSLLRAGLLPRVAVGALTPAGSRDWPRVVFTPGARPMHAAASALLKAFTNEGGASVPPDPGPGDLDDLLAEAVAAAGPQARAVLVVDQFEELFRLCEHEDERGAFISWLWQAAQGEVPGGPAVLAACAVRADFYPDCTRYPQIRQALQDNQVIVGAMSPEELREAITCPAEAAGLDIEPGLTELLLADLHAISPAAAAGDGSPAADDGAGRLPLLASALRATWQLRHGSTLTVDGYRAAGRIEDAVADNAERVYGRLGKSDQQTARGLFLRLVKIGATSGEDVRRPVSGTALAGGSGSAKAVIDACTAARLLTQSLDTVQITHEALLSAWPRLRRWLEEDRAGSLIRQAIEDTAADWERAGRDASLLYRGARLENAVTWASDRSGELTHTAGSFLAASRRAAVRTTRIWRAVMVVLASLALFASAAAVIASQQRANATHAATEADTAAVAAASGQLAAQSEAVDAVDPLQAAELAAASWRLAPTARARAQARVSLLDVLAQPDRGVLAVPGAAVDAVAFSPDGKTLAAASDNGTARLWDIATQSPTSASMTADGNPLTAVAFSPDGKILATGDSGGEVRLWDVATRQQIGAAITADGVPVNAVAFSPNGTMLATASDDGTARLWDVSTHSQVGAPMTADAKPVDAVAFSPDGKILATASDDGTARLWSVRTHRQVGAPMTVDGEAMLSVVFSPDGKTLATATLGSAVARLWDVATQQQVASLWVSNVQVLSVAFSPDGTMLAIGSADDNGAGTARLWDVSTQQQIGTPLIADSTFAESVAFSPDGKTLATAGQDDTARLWNVGTQQQIGAPMTAGRDYAYAVAFSPDGKILATADCDGTVRLWNVATRQQIGAPMLIGACVHNLAFSPDGKILAAGSLDGKVELRDATTHQVIGAPIVLHASVYGMAFSPDGKILATGDSGGAVRLWDVATRQQIGAAMTADDNYVRSVAFSPDGTMLATASDDGTARLWDVATQQQIGTPITPADTSLAQVTFNPDGTVLATSGGDSPAHNGSAQLWDVAFPRDLAGAVCAYAGHRSLTPAQWAADVPSEPFEQTCP